ncbi:hypothetical protein FRC14_002715 [Serendipita sp. 396]|nr:hypothetical protein FRC14_002715 [Serendipita sp. 396]KAG8789740.1 hypothetical protein FRC15_003809 [Serendipita sp. 397]KAG8804279.1 hypothetical protein FRC16_010608 [Serendipita sp. 398]KAG8823270.1 hypothetical protein FRC19_004292 [Serendipita sp. 401]KAG8838351.1 hypothetical protein FRC18_004956 [Serendipita sp. 400]KAG8877489.1 hypothetical protein FRC20_011158 [Serendipita sp. 405]KAG9055046.1 hypothetical protein FS842_003305 [Serendipita sp. 407]
MWFRNSSNRKPAKTQQREDEQQSHVEPLLPQLGEPSSRSRDSSPTKATRVSATLTPTTPVRPDAPRSQTSPIIIGPPDIVAGEAAPRLSISSTIGGNGSTRALQSNYFLQPPAPPRSHRNTSSINLFEEELEGSDRLFDSFTGKPIATLHTTRFDPLPTIDQGGGPDVTGKHRNTGDMEDPARQKMWDYLAKIRSLQAEVAAMHFAMDGQALGEPWGARPGGRSRSGSVNFGPKDLIGKSSFLERNSSAPKVTVQPEPLGRKRRDNESEEERIGEKNAKMDEEFQALDRMYEEKQEMLNAVTSKLRELSSVIRAYHELENPVIASTSRQDTVESKFNLYYDSPSVVESPTPSPKKNIMSTEPQKLRPRLSLAPALTASPTSSPPPSPLPYHSQPSPFVASGRISQDRRTSLELGAGGGRHLYVPLSPGTSGPSPLPMPSSPPKH